MRSRERETIVSVCLFSAQNYSDKFLYRFRFFAAIVYSLLIVKYTCRLARLDLLRRLFRFCLVRYSAFSPYLKSYYSKFTSFPNEFGVRSTLVTHLFRFSNFGTQISSYLLRNADFKIANFKFYFAD